MTYKRKRKKKMSASKIILAIILLICLEIIIYSEIIMGINHDLSALYVLMGIPAAMCGTAWAYFTKAKAENTEGGITYETAMAEIKQEAQNKITIYDLNNDDIVG